MHERSPSQRDANTKTIRTEDRTLSATTGRAYVSTSYTLHRMGAETLSRGPVY